MEEGGGRSEPPVSERGVRGMDKNKPTMPPVHHRTPSMLTKMVKADIMRVRDVDLRVLKVFMRPRTAVMLCESVHDPLV